jgi:hypothetical protein
MADDAEVAAALRRIARAIEHLADVVAPAPEDSEQARTLALLREWGARGLTRPQASALFSKHGFAPQTAGGWSRGGWIELGEDGLRYASSSSREWVAEQDG